MLAGVVHPGRFFCDGDPKEASLASHTQIKGVASQTTKHAATAFVWITKSLAKTKLIAPTSIMTIMFQTKP